MTIREIAKLANVSITTVSKIMNNKDENISQETRERVLKVVKEYNYTPYSTVKNSTAVKTFLIGLLLKNTSQTGQMVNGILQAAQEHNYGVLLFDSQDSPEQELKHITSYCQNRVDGILWEPVSEESKKNAHYLEEAQIEVCYIHSRSPKNSLFIDYQKLGYLCTQKLIEYRHSKIGCLLKPDSFRSSQVLEGFQKCLFDHQLSFHDSMVLDISDPDCMEAIISPGFTGVVSSHFASAISLYKQLTRMHYHVPADLSLISLRSDSREFMSFPSISSYEIPYLEFGYKLCSSLIGKCESPEKTFSFSFDREYTLDHEQSLGLPYNFRSKKIIVAGSINKDITFLVDTLPQPGKATIIKNVSFTLGGKGSNQAVAATRLGKETALLGKIGNDIDSNYILEVLNQEKVTTTGVYRENNAQTGKAYIYLQKGGEGTISILPGSNAHFSPEDLAAQEYLFNNSSFCLLSSEIPADTMAEAVRLAQKYGVKTILKPAAIKTFPKALFEKIDFFVPNKKEAALLAPDHATVEDQASYFFQKGIPHVIITLGEDGCYLKTASHSEYFPAANFTTVDTTGGADAFVAALAVYLSDGYSLTESIRIAQYAAGFCISRQGVTPALVDKNTLQAYISHMEPDLIFHS